MMKRIVFLIFAAMFLFVISDNCASAKIINLKEHKSISEKIKPASETLSLINKYQTKYFEIIKRNDILLNFEDNAKLNKDRKELKKLSVNVEKQITDKNYLKKYKKIKKQIGKCDGVTTPEINECAENDYNLINNFLNEVYKEVGTKISPEDFRDLTLNQNKWKKEVENYKKVYDSMDFGTIGTSVYYEYEICMREFRILLLMLYL